MAVLNASQRQEVAETLMRRWTEREYAPGMTSKTGLAAVVAAIDTWRDSSAAAANTAIPQPYRSQLSAAAKSEIAQVVFEVATAAALEG